MTRFAEIAGFGLNMLTLSFIATLIFTSLQAIAFLRQNKRIVKTKSGLSVSFSFYSFFGFSALAMIVFGLTNKSLALSISGLLGILSLIIAFNLWRFKKLSRSEKIIGALSFFALPTMIISPNRDIIFLTLGIIIGATIGTQIMEIWRNKNSGAYHPAQIFISIASGSFWFVYAFIMNIWSMKIVNSLFFILWITLLFSYLKFRKNKKPS